MASPTNNNERFQQQLAVVHQSATAYWQTDLVDNRKDLDAIQVVKVTGGKMAAILPAHNGFPSVFCKVYFYDRGFQFEVAGLQAADAMPLVSGVRVPAVISVMPQFKAIISERRSWHDSASPIKRFFIQSLRVDWANIGAWLRQFHDSQVSSERNDYFLRKKFEKIAAHIQVLSPLFTNAQLGQMEHIIQSAREYFKTTPVEWVISHGDFGLDNIKFADGIMDIIDFEDCQPAPRAFDILNFLTRLDYTGRFPHRYSTYDRIRSEFLSSYGMPLEPTPAANLFYLLIKLDMIESYQRRQVVESAWLYSTTVYRHFKLAGLKQLTNWLDIYDHQETTFWVKS